MGWVYGGVERSRAELQASHTKTSHEPGPVFIKPNCDSGVIAAHCRLLRASANTSIGAQRNPRIPMRRSFKHLVLALGLSCASFGAVQAQECPTQVPVQGAPVPGPLPVFPVDNWWNVDISSAPVDTGSPGYISFIGGTRRLHPDFGGEESPGSTAIY